jgi:hypothetical protein
MSKYDKGPETIQETIDRLTVSQHALVIKDGIVIDNPNYKFTGYRRIVESACLIK